MHTDFALPIKLSLSQLMSFLTFALLILSLIPMRGGGEGRVSGCVVLGCWLGLNHDNHIGHFMP